MEPRTKRIHVRVTEDEDLAIKKRAASLMLTPSEYVRRSALSKKTIAAELRPLNAALREVVVESNNLKNETEKHLIQEKLTNVFEVLNQLCSKD